MKETAATQQTPAPQKKRGRRSRLVRVLAAFLFLVFVSTIASAAWWVRTDDFQLRVVPVVETVVEQQTGEAFTLGRIDIHFWPPAIELTDARLWHLPTQDTIVSADRVYAPLVLRDGGIRLGRLAVEEPVLVLHVEEDWSLREFRHVARGSGGGMKTVPWGSLRLDRGTVRVHIPDGRVVATDISIDPTEGSTATVMANVVYWFRSIDDSTAIHWTDVELGPDKLFVPRFLLDSGLIHLDGTAELALDGAIDINLNGRGDLEKYNVLLVEPKAVHGLIDFDLHAHGSGPNTKIDLVLQGNHLALDVPGATVPVINYEFGDLVAVVHGGPEGAVIERAVLSMADGRIEAWGVVTKDLELREGHVLAEGLSLEKLIKALDAAPTPWVDFSGDAEVVVSGTLNPLHLEGPFELAVSDWHVGDRPISDPGKVDLLYFPFAHARGRLVVEKDHLEVDAPIVRGPNNSGSCTVNVGFGPRGPLDLHFDMTHADLSDFQPLGDVGLQGVGRIKGRLYGKFRDLRLMADGDIENFEVLGIPYADRLISPIESPDLKRLILPDAHAWLGDTRYAGTFALDFRSPMSMSTDIVLTEGRVEDVIGMFIDLEGITGNIEGTMHLDGPLLDMDGETHINLTDVEIYGEKFPIGEGHGYLDKGLFTLDDLRVTRHDRTAGLVLRGSVLREWALNMELVGDGFRLERMDLLAPADLPLSGRVSVIARLDNTLYDPAPQGRLTVTDVRYSGHPVDDSYVKFRTTNGVSHYEGKLVGGSVAVVGTQGLWEEQPYLVFASFSNFPAHLLYPVAADGESIEAFATGKVNLEGHFGEFPSPVELDSEVSKARLSWRSHSLTNTEPWRYHQHGEEFSLEGFGLQGGQTALSLSGSGGAHGLDLDGEGRFDLDLLRMVVPYLSRAEGTADFTLFARGSAPAVETVIDARIAGSLLRHDSFPGAIEDVTARVVATQDGYLLDDVRGSLGGGGIAGGGRIFAEHWIPTRYDLAGSARDAQLQWVDHLPPAIGDADLRFDGPVDALLLSGEVTIRDMMFSDRIDWEDWVVEYRDWAMVEPAPSDVEPYFGMDLHITGDETITLRNNVVEGSASADLRIIGDTSRAGMVGEIEVGDTVIFLQDREFQVDRGLISYRDPWTWDPDIDFDLITDIVSRDRRYRITYMARGPFSDWRTETRSDPQLAQADINALLWFGVTADDLEEMGELPQAVAQGVADMILTDLVLTRGGGVREELSGLVDRVELATGVDSRGEYSADPRLLIEKRFISDQVDVTGTVELNTVDREDVQVRADFRLSDTWSLAAWYASKERRRVGNFSGAGGVDVRWRWETD